MKFVVATGLQRASDSPSSFPSPTQTDMCRSIQTKGRCRQQGCSGAKTETQPLIIGVSGLFVYGMNSSGVEPHTTGPESSTLSPALPSAGSLWEPGDIRTRGRERQRRSPRLPPAGGSSAPPCARPPFKPRATRRVPLIGRRPARRPAGCREL